MTVEQSCRALEQAADRHHKAPAAEARKAMRDALLGAATASAEIIRREGGPA